ncbi:MAG: rhodanese-like domain-containing protein [Jatrophihabitans sp.]
MEPVPSVSVADLPADAVLLDVREDEEWVAGHIDGAVHMPMMSVPQRLGYDPGPVTPDAHVVVVCKVGGRSAQVTAWLRAQGYNAANLTGGMLAWDAAGKQMISETAQPPAVV